MCLPNNESIVFRYLSNKHVTDQNYSVLVITYERQISWELTYETKVATKRYIPKSIR